MHGLYIHFPFCSKKCRYCDFYSVTDTVVINKIIESVIAEIKLRGTEFHQGEIVDTVFIGGGTPSLMSPEQLEFLMTAVRKYFRLADNTEITIECNPGTITIESLSAYRNTGVNRLSIGVQSFVAEELEFLGRIHDAGEAEKALVIASEAGFDNINADIIFSVPGQTAFTLEYTLNKLLELEPAHISAYCLIYENGTPLFNDMKSGKVVKYSDEMDAKFFEVVSGRLTAAGYEHYEVSNFALKGRKCQHNLKYWAGCEYFGIGPSAHGFINGRRYWNYRSVTNYIRYLSEGRLPVEGYEELTKKQKIAERILLGLRSEGIDTTAFKSEFGIDLLQEELRFFEELKISGYLYFENGRICLTTKGYLLSDEISVKLCSLIEKSK